MSAADPRSCGVTLTTDDPANVALYKHFGYGLTGEVEVPGAFRTWGFFRPNPHAEQGTWRSRHTAARYAN